MKIMPISNNELDKVSGDIIDMLKRNLPKYIKDIDNKKIIHAGENKSVYKFDMYLDFSDIKLIKYNDYNIKGLEILGLKPNNIDSTIYVYNTKDFLDTLCQRLCNKIGGDKYSTTKTSISYKFECDENKFGLAFDECTFYNIDKSTKHNILLDMMNFHYKLEFIIDDAFIQKQTIYEHIRLIIENIKDYIDIIISICEK